jgi:light-regulated signal transduction histidine kinase (bacteriophytochrome)
VKVAISPDSITYGERNLLQLVLENLVGNAWRFSIKVAETCIEIGNIENNGNQTYFIRDNWIGFDMTYTGKLFKPFQRLHKASEFPGTGIGLATVQRIIHRHGGEVWAESEVGNWRNLCISY